MKTKTCFKCLVLKKINEFYTHKQTKDGHLNKCKSCTKTDTAQNKQENSKNPHWVIKNREWKRINARKRREQGVPPSTSKKYCNPLKAKAKEKVAIEIRKQTLKKENCCVCDSRNSQAHHEDYSKPLEVIWLCPRHHSDRHIYLRNCDTLKIEPEKFDPKNTQFY